jgi:hypothetical protein
MKICQSTNEIYSSYLFIILDIAHIKSVDYKTFEKSVKTELLF